MITLVAARGRGWLERRPDVLRLLHPALPSHPGHGIWKRDFSGASGLFSMVLKPVPQKAYYAFLDALDWRTRTGSEEV